LSEDVNVDELRRRARRRLVGAIVLALAAAVVVPMLLESEPRPLGEDVAVRIPPVDDGKFVNRLNEPSAKTDARPGAPRPDAGAKSPAAPGDTTAKAPAGAPPPGASNAIASETTGTARPKYDTSLTPKDAPPGASGGASGGGTSAAPGAAPAPAAAPTPPASPTPTPATPAASSSAASSPSDGAKGAGVTTTRPPSGSAPASGPTPAAAASGPAAGPASGAAPSAPAKSASSSPAAPKGDGAYAVQLAAFSDDKGANALAGRLKRAGYTAYTEPVKSTKGTLYRVRVGPYASKDAATAAREKLKGEGQDGIVAPVH